MIRDTKLISETETRDGKLQIGRIDTVGLTGGHYLVAIEPATGQPAIAVRLRLLDLVVLRGRLDMEIRLAASGRT